MAERTQKKSAERSIIYCLLCQKPQESLPSHLARVCMKDSSQNERYEELQRAKASHRGWVVTGRTWDYKKLCVILPDLSSRQNMVKELIQLGFFVKNQPEESELGLERKDWHNVLRAGKAEFLRIFKKLQSGAAVSGAEKRLYRFYCESVLVYRHHQSPGTVKGFTDEDWVGRIHEGGRVLTGFHRHTARSQQTVTLALTVKEEAWFQAYFSVIRPENILPEKCCSNFFISSSGEAISNVSNDMERLHEMLKLPMVNSSAVRKAVQDSAKTLPAPQQEGISAYLLQQHYRKPQPQDIVNTAVLLDSLAGFSSDNDDESPSESTSSPDFSTFLSHFPVTCGGQPPNKKQRITAGFPDDRVFYDKWRNTQYLQRQEYLTSQFTHRKPSAAKVARLIAQEGWTSNHSKPEDIVRLWKPASKSAIETDESFIKCVSEQTWKGLAIKDFGAEQGLGVVATRRFSKGDIVCDYHGKVITAAQGRAMMRDLHDEAGYMFFFKAGQKDLCVDAQTFPCDCHPEADTFGRRINHSSKMPNLKPFHCVLKVNGKDKDVVLFKALHDIRVDEQLKFDYGVKRKSFRGEGLDLKWLDE